MITTGYFQVLTAALVVIIFLGLLYWYSPSLESFSEDCLARQTDIMDSPDIESLKIDFEQVAELDKKEAEYLNQNRHQFGFVDASRWQDHSMYQMYYSDWINHPCNHRYLKITHRGEPLIWVEMFSNSSIPRTMSDEIWLPSGLILDSKTETFVGLYLVEIFSEKTQTVWAVEKR